MLRLVVVLTVAGCAAETESRLTRIVDVLADDNYVSGLREPALVEMKLRKMQRSPYEWLRGTAALYWRDLTEPGLPRASTAFGSPAASRVLLVGDPHLENIGTFRASDGTMFVDWNDFDATGYGPYGGDVRRLGASLVLVAELGVPADPALGVDLVRIAATRYAETIGELAAGTRLGALGPGAHPLLDDELAKARSRGDAGYALNELAPASDGVRALARGDLEPVAADGVIEDRVLEVDAAQAAWIDRAIATWSRDRLDASAAVVLLRARRVGSGVASYAVYRFNVVLAGPTSSPEDDVLVELKETRDGLIVAGVPRLASPEWETPSARSVDTQRRLQVRPDADALLGLAQIGGLSLKIRDREAYQRGIDAGDLIELAQDDPDRLRDLAGHYGALLGRAHGQAWTEDRVPGHVVIAPLLAGREPAFADEIVELATQDARLLVSDFELARALDLGALVIPGGS